jgi:lipooligosaccharide transport system permease protein
MTATVRPTSRFAGVRHVVEFNMLRFRSYWRTSVITSFVQPLMYLLGMGIGVGSLVNRSGGQDRVLGGVDYVAFLAPGLLVTTAMFVGAGEATWPILGNFRWTRTFHAQFTTPIDAISIVVGQMAWIALRMFASAGAVAVAMCLIPSTRSTGLPVAVFAGVLAGMALAVPTAAYSATKEQDAGFVGYHRFLIMPLFLFGGAFYPVSQLPAVMRPIARITPLWHGVEIARGACLHTLGVTKAAGHVAYLIAWVVVGLVFGVRTFQRRLEK